MENMMNKLFSHISSDESTLDQQNNEQSTNKQPKESKNQINKNSTKLETTSCATCNSNFNTTRGLQNNRLLK